MNAQINGKPTFLLNDFRKKVDKQVKNGRYVAGTPACTRAECKRIRVTSGLGSLNVLHESSRVCCRTPSHDPCV